MFSIVLYPSINKGIYLINRNRIGGAKVGRLECRIVGSSLYLVKSKSIMLVFAASLLRIQYWSKSKDRWTRNPVNMSECSDTSTRVLLFQ